MNKLKNKILTYIFTLVVIIILILTLYIFTKNNNTNYNEKNNKDSKKANVLIRQSARYAHAARQDKDLLIALLHANYSSGYLFAAKDIFPENLLISLFPSYKDYKEFEAKIKEIQDEVNTRAVSGCPSMVSKKDIITKMGGESS